MYSRKAQDILYLSSQKQHQGPYSAMNGALAVPAALPEDVNRLIILFMHAAEQRVLACVQNGERAGSLMYGAPQTGCYMAWIESIGVHKFEEIHELKRGANVIGTLWAGVSWAGGPRYRETLVDLGIPGNSSVVARAMTLEVRDDKHGVISVEASLPRYFDTSLKKRQCFPGTSLIIGGIPLFPHANPYDIPLKTGDQIKLGPPYLYELNVAKGKAHPKTIAALRKLAPIPPPPPSESESEDYEHYSDTDSSADLERTLLIHASD